MKIAMLSTGEEVLHGDITDTNAAWLSRLFFEHGFALAKRSTVGDQKADLVNELVNLSLNFDLVIVNGGLGPTTDDLTAEAAAEAADDKLVLFEAWWERMQAMYASSGRQMPESNRKQAVLPAECTIVDNPIGTACGFCMTINRATFYFTPGVPREFKRMVTDEILPEIKRTHSNVAGLSVSRMYTFGLSESGISDLLDKVVLPAGYEFGYRSSMPFIEVKLFGPDGDIETRMRILKIVYGHLGDNVVSIDEPLLANIGSALQESGQTVSVSEQFTGGYLSAWMSRDEAFEHVMGQAWVLTNSAKIKVQQQDALPSALALAASIREKTGSSIGLAIGKLEQDTIAVAMSAKEGEWGQVLSVRRKYEREDMRKLVAAVVLDMLRRRLESKPVFGSYSSLQREREMFIPSSAL